MLLASGWPAHHLVSVGLHRIPTHHCLSLLILPPQLRQRLGGQQGCSSLLPPQGWDTAGTRPWAGRRGPGGLCRAGGIWTCPFFPPVSLHSSGQRGHAGPSGDNQGQTLQEYVPAPPSPGRVGLAPPGHRGSLHPLIPLCLQVPWVSGGGVRKEGRGREVSALPFLGRAGGRQGSVSLCTQAAGCDADGEPGVGAGPKSTHSSRPGCLQWGGDACAGVLGFWWAGSFPPG